MKKQFPILEFDPDPTAILNPFRHGIEKEPPTKCVLCFFFDVLLELTERKVLSSIGCFRSEMGLYPVYSVKYHEQDIVVMNPGVGAPLAAGRLEELIIWGIDLVVACGGCGVLDKELTAGHLVIIDSAIRDEGTSYHYLPPGREVNASPRVTKTLEDVVKSHQLPYIMGKSWTTDGLFRETIAKREQRVKEGCIVVEMEAAALFAVAQFRKINIGQIVYGGDMVIPEGWDHRDWFKRKDVREKLFWLAVEACVKG